MPPHLLYALSALTLEYVSSQSHADALAPLVSGHWYLTDGDTDSELA